MYFEKSCFNSLDFSQRRDPAIYPRGFPKATLLAKSIAAVSLLLCSVSALGPCSLYTKTVAVFSLPRKGTPRLTYLWLSFANAVLTAIPHHQINSYFSS